MGGGDAFGDMSVANFLRTCAREPAANNPNRERNEPLTLSEQLAKFRENFESKTPSEITEEMHRATEELRNSGILDRVLKKGDRAPEFTLPDTNGVMVSSAVLLQRGPLVVSFFRGKW